MELMTRKKRAAKYMKRLHILYEHSPMIPGSIDKQLLSLGANPEPEEVDKIIGHNGKTKCVCDECGESKDFIILIGKDYNTMESFDSMDSLDLPLEICRACLEKAARCSYTEELKQCSPNSETK